MAFRDGALYVGASPNGKVYRVDPNSGKGTVFVDPKQAYIWSMVFLPTATSRLRPASTANSSA